MKIKKVPKTDLDYVEFYAENLKINPKFFRQQKDLIESQMTSSSVLAKKRFSKDDFKLKVRAHLKEIGVRS